MRDFSRRNGLKQILQNLANGATEVTDVPCPVVGPAQVLIRAHLSLVSAGTERMLVEFGKAGWIAKARQQPEKVRMVFEKIETDGWLSTIASVRSKLDQKIAMGYCNIGTVIAVGERVTQFAIGDRVISNGRHAEVVTVPVNLCAKVPDAVSDDEAVFTVLGAIALQGIRLAQPGLGDAVVVTGLGLVGLIAVQLLRAHGCRVLGIDFDENRLALARQFGAQVVNLSAREDPISAAHAFSRGKGVDAVLVTAATRSSEPMRQAAVMSRKRGRIVLVGMTGLELSRADFYEKELTFQVSCSYGPGRYDPEYEEKGRDYPVGYVRWTEQRNFEAVLDMLAERRVDFRALVSHRIAFDKAPEAYELLDERKPSLGIILEFPRTDKSRSATLTDRTVCLAASAQPAREGLPTVGFIGAGGYGSAVLIPAFRKAGVRLGAIASNGGVSAVHAGRKFGFERATTDASTIISDADIDTMIVCTRHDTHAYFVCEALRAGKHVFVEKPLAISPAQLDEVEDAYRSECSRGSGALVMAGFNRRFAPQIVKMKKLLDSMSEPKSFIMTVNAGLIPENHWTQDHDVGGGRIIGEGCHFIDLLRFLADAPIVQVQAQMIGRSVGLRNDKVSFTLAFADGSFGTVHYLANGHKSFPKERLEVFCAGRILQLDNFRRLTGYGWPGFRSMKLWSQDKGNDACAAAFVDAIAGGKPSPIPFDQLVEVARVTFEITGCLRS
jgi:predicted dehydrogenase/threonine dehydrogenase-like Zn-dependent dehydrogenase